MKNSETIDKDKMIEVSATIKRLKFNSDDFYIYEAFVEKSDSPDHNVDGKTISLTGKFENRLYVSETYNLYGQVSDHPKFGKQLEVHFVNVERNTPVQIERFLSQFISANISKRLVQEYQEDTIDRIVKSEVDIDKIWGLGIEKFNTLREKVLENVYMKDVIAGLAELGISKTSMKAIATALGPDAAEKIRKNPYCLCSVRGFGFEKADDFAMRMGFDPNSPFRIDEAVKYVLEQESFNGNSWTTKRDVYNKVEKATGLSKKLVADRIYLNEDIVIEDDTVGLRYIFNTEDYVADVLTEMASNNPIDQRIANFDMEGFLQKAMERHGLQLTDEQKQIFENFKESRVNFLVGYAGCVDEETEFFDGYGWKKVSAYAQEDMVLQYEDDGSSTLVYPLSYHKIKSKTINLIRGSKINKVDMSVCDDHDFLYKNNRGRIIKKKFWQIKEDYEEKHNSTHHKLITTFENKASGCEITELNGRLAIMILAAGSYPLKGSNCVMIVHSMREVGKVKRLLDRIGVEYDLVRNKFNSTYKITFDIGYRISGVSPYWYRASATQRKMFLTEITFWFQKSKSNYRTGSVIKFTFPTKELADFAQFLLTTEKGYYSQIQESLNPVKYHVVCSPESPHMHNLSIASIQNQSGLKYCFTVPSGMFVSRRNGQIAVTGNCGKTALQVILVELLHAMGLSTILLAPTGKAAKVMSEYTGQEAQTIHRAIGIGMHKEDRGFKLITEDVIIVDESSMADVFLIEKLLKALDGTNQRIIFVGDDFQLPSVGVGNFLHDCIQGDSFKVAKLTKVFRQAEGGLLDIATKIRSGDTFLRDRSIELLKFGKDIEFVCTRAELIKQSVGKTYRKMLEKYDSSDIIVLSPKKSGAIGTIELNNSVQGIVNPPEDFKNEIDVGGIMKIREGDRVLNTKNTYSAVVYGNNYDDKYVEADDDGNLTTTVVNGDVGVVTKVFPGKETVIVDFGFAEVVFGKKEMKNLLLAYVMTVHKSQGSGFKCVIAIGASEHVFMLNANLIYTAITRTKEFCTFVCNSEAVNTGMRKYANKRNTYLQKILQDRSSAT